MERPRIFINYRSTDTGETASGLYRDLTLRLGRSSVFIDHDRIEGGEEWPRRLRDEVNIATVMLCLIGKKWLGSDNSDPSQNLLNDANDWVRLEISRALEREILTIPIYVEGAPEPKARDLPAEMSSLASRQGLSLTRKEWDSHIRRILEQAGCDPDDSLISYGPGATPLPVGGAFFRPADIRFYLKDLVERMKKRNEVSSTASLDPYIELEAQPQGESLVSDAEYPRERGHILSFPRISPAIAEVNALFGGMGGIGVPSDVIGMRTKPVRSVLRVLRSRQDPLVVLGEPGSGKSTTLRELAIELASRALLFPQAPIPIYVELGAFRGRIDANPNGAIIDLIRESVPPGVNSLRSHLTGTFVTTPVVVLFDAMDEIPRLGDYPKRISALASFADNYYFIARTVFACRSNDFNSTFGHVQLVLKPFDERRIRSFLRQTLGRRFVIDGGIQTPKSAARRLMQINELAADAGNPLALSLAVHYMDQHKRWPRGRTVLFEDHLAALAFRSLRRAGVAKPTDDQIRTIVDSWAGLAYEIFKKDGAVFISRQTLEESVGKGPVDRAIGGGLLMEDALAGLLKFRHHRLQEFLVARRLRLPFAPQPDWLEVLASPRWQETLLNYFAIGGHNDVAVQVILESLRPAEEYLERLRPLVERSTNIVARAQKNFDNIGPDVTRQVGHAAAVTYSAEQRARKNAARERLKEVSRRHQCLRTLSIDREMMWSDHLSFAARVRGLLQQPATNHSDLSQPIAKVMSGLFDFGRPAAQVRMLTAWRDCSDWCPASILDPARLSKLARVRSQAIAAIAAAPLRRDNLDHTFSEELEWEVLNLRLLIQLPVYWETAGLRRGRRLRVVLAMAIYLMTVVIALVIIATTGAVAIAELHNVRSALSHRDPLTLEFAWFGLIGFFAIFTVPVLQWHLLTRVMAINALAGGVVLAWLRIGLIPGGLENPAPNWGEWCNHLVVLGWLAAPALATSAALIGVFLITRFTFDWKGSTDQCDHAYSTLLKTSETYLRSWQIGGTAGVCVVIGAFLFLFHCPWGHYKTVVLNLMVVFIFLILGGVAIIVVGGVISDRWNNLGKRSPICRVFIICREAVAITLVMGSIVGLFGLLFYGATTLCQFIVNSIFSPETQHSIGIFFVIAALTVSALTLSIAFGGLIFKYIFGAFGSTFAEFRYLLFRWRLRRLFYKGSFSDWTAEFESASKFRRRELVDALDYRAIGVSPEEVLRTFQRLENMVGLEDPGAGRFHQIMYQMQEEIRQRRWTVPIVEEEGTSAASG